MEENVNDVLGVATENTPTVKTAAEEPKAADNSAEKTLIMIANIVLVCGIIATIVCLFSIVWVEDPSWTYRTKYMFNPSGFVTTIMVLFTSLISWSFMKVLANISITLKEINTKTK